MRWVLLVLLSACVEREIDATCGDVCSQGTSCVRGVCVAAGTGKAPSGIAYTANPATYKVGQPISPNTCKTYGGVAQLFEIDGLPPGLVIDPTSGTISGTPEQASPLTSHLVYAINASGSALTELAISVAPSVVVTLPSSASVPANGNITLVATVSGTTESSVSWSTSCGTISSLGVFHAPLSPQICMATATSVVDPGATAQIAVEVTPVTIAITPSTAVVEVYESESFAATISGLTNSAVTWSIDEQKGSVSQAGIFTADSTAGVVHLRATSVEDSSFTAVVEIHMAPVVLQVLGDSPPSPRVGYPLTLNGYGFGTSSAFQQANLTPNTVTDFIDWQPTTVSFTVPVSTQTGLVSLVVNQVPSNPKSLNFRWRSSTQALADPTLIDTTTDGYPNAISAVSDAENGTIVGVPSPSGARLHRVSSAGVLLWTREISEPTASVVSDSRGGAIVLTDGPTVRRFDALGNLLFSTTLASGGTSASAAVTGTAIIVAWRSSSGHIAAHSVLLSGGNAEWPDAIDVGVPAPGQSYSLPTVVSDGSGGAVIAWETTTRNMALMQRVSAAGTLVFAATRIIASAMEVDISGMTRLTDGSVALAWYERFVEASSGDTLRSFFVQRFLLADGTPMWSPPRGRAVSDGNSGTCIPGLTKFTGRHDCIAELIDGDLAVTWISEIGGFALAQRLGRTTGTLQWNAQHCWAGLASGEDPNTNVRPVITTDDAGNIYATFSTPNAEQLIGVQKLDAVDGSMLWGPSGRTIPYVRSFRGDHALVRSNQLAPILVWSQLEYDNSLTIHAQRF